MQTINLPSLHLIAIVSASFLLSAPTVNAAESYYKCKNGKDETTYSEQPCAAKKNQKITIKDNTLDHTELRKSPMYREKRPQYDAVDSGEKAIENSVPSVGSIKKIEGAGYQPTTNTNTGSAANTPWP